MNGVLCVARDLEHREVGAGKGAEMVGVNVGEKCAPEHSIDGHANSQDEHCVGDWELSSPSQAFAFFRLSHEGMRASSGTRASPAFTHIDWQIKKV